MAQILDGNAVASRWWARRAALVCDGHGGRGLLWTSREVEQRHVEAGAVAPQRGRRLASWWLVWGARISSMGGSGPLIGRPLHRGGGAWLERSMELHGGRRQVCVSAAP